jgi:hypothetical protein
MTAMMQVARVYSNRPEIFTKLSWGAIVALASATLPLPARQVIEARVVAGEKIVVADIVRARQAHASRRPADQRAMRLAA